MLRCIAADDPHLHPVVREIVVVTPSIMVHPVASSLGWCLTQKRGYMGVHYVGHEEKEMPS
jgi:hypothetical protein